MTGIGGTLDELLAGLGVAVLVRHAVSGVVRGTPTPVQSLALGPALSGADLLAVAPTGSGKSLVFAVALAHELAGAPSVPGRPRALVVAPTRELAQQDAKVVAAVGAGSGLRVECFVGGGPTSRDRRRTIAPVDIAVGTPGRLLDLVRSGVLGTGDVRTVVLDEADHLLAGSFAEQTTGLLDRSGHHRLLAVTATADEGCESALRERRPGLEVRRADAPVPTSRVDRSSTETGTEPRSNAPDRLVLVVDEDPVAAAGSLATRCRRALFFVARRDLVEGVRDAVARHGVAAAGVDGTASPTRRHEAFGALASGAVAVLVTTDLSGRGLDLPSVGHVVHVGLPHSAEDLVHRSGRTGRGRTAAGVVAAVVAPDEVGRLRALAGSAGLDLVDCPPERRDELVGPVVAEAPPRRRRATAPPARTRRPATSRPHRPKRKRRS